MRYLFTLRSWQTISVDVDADNENEAYEKLGEQYRYASVANENGGKGDLDDEWEIVACDNLSEMVRGE